MPRLTSSRASSTTFSQRSSLTAKRSSKRPIPKQRAARKIGFDNKRQPWASVYHLQRVQHFKECSSGVIEEHEVLRKAELSCDNSGVGLSLHDAASVSVQNTGVFSNNGGFGISVTTNSILDLEGYGGPISVSNNTGDGISAERSVINGGGNLVITN